MVVERLYFGRRLTNPFDLHRLFFGAENPKDRMPARKSKHGTIPRNPVKLMDSEQLNYQIRIVNGPLLEAARDQFDRLQKQIAQLREDLEKTQYTRDHLENVMNSVGPLEVRGAQAIDQVVRILAVNSVSMTVDDLWRKFRIWGFGCPGKDPRASFTAYLNNEIQRKQSRLVVVPSPDGKGKRYDLSPYGEQEVWEGSTSRAPKRSPEPPPPPPPPGPPTSSPGGGPPAPPPEPAPPPRPPTSSPRPVPAPTGKTFKK